MITIEWCKDVEFAAELGHFFASNISAEYISHSELQGPRATDVGSWASNLEEILTKEIEVRIRSALSAKPGEEIPEGNVLAAWDRTLLVGLGLVSFFPAAPIPYGMVEDIVVAKERRGGGIGAEMLQWVTEQATKYKYRRLFLESGFRNDRAHKFFEIQGFTPCSIVMFKSLRPVE